MKKAELLEEIRCKLGLLLKESSDVKDWYHMIISDLKEKVAHYQSISIYLTDENSFYYFSHVGDDKAYIDEVIPFGEGMLSLVAARAEISCDFIPGGQYIIVPFYQRHFLIGEMVIKTSQFIDEDELKFLRKIQELLNSVPQ